VLRALADSQLNQGNLAGARRNYEALVRLNIKDADTLNNLAHVLLRQNDAGALKVAEQALAIAPDAAHIIGTTGWAAFKAKQNDRAIQLLRNSRSRAPDNADTRFYLASVLAAMGRNGEARTELTAALAANSGLNHRPEAEQLLTTLR
jgi:tetratricopeptide (TPR) repeat protein